VRLAGARQRLQDQEIERPRRDLVFAHPSSAAIV
jgi:hypothetical protein